MNKTEFIMRQLSKTNKKSFEHYVITRIWHMLNDTNIKFVTQQYVKRPEGRALTDMYFPQINLHVEVDEGHHFNKVGKQVNEDLIRDADIINASGTKPERIKVCGDSRYDLDISLINSNIDKVIKVIKDKFDNTPIKTWDIESEYNPQTYINLGYISAEDNVAFRTITDACNCFGNSYKGCQRGFVKHPIEDKYLWFPKLYPNDGWNNQISADENEIHMIKIEGNAEFFAKNIESDIEHTERLTFARVVSNLGDVMYRFKGGYKTDIEDSIKKGFFIYRRVSIEAKTYKPL